MRNLLFSLLCCLVLSPLPAEVATLRVGSGGIRVIPPAMFSQFCEITAGETGPDGAVDPATGDLRPEAEALIRELAPPMIRYPGGFAVEQWDWSWYLPGAASKPALQPGLSHVGPGLPPLTAPYHARLSVDRFLALCQRVGSEPVLCLPMRPALDGRSDPARHAESLAAIVAYLNAPTDAALSEELRTWAKRRAADGRAQPWGVRWIQLGNELFFVKPRTEESDAACSARWVDTLVLAVQAIDRVDPTVRFITDAQSATIAQLIRTRLGDRIAMLAEHVYVPFGFSKVRDANDRPVAKIPIADQWRAWLSVPDIDTASGQSMWQRKHSADPQGYPLAITEWNHNHWYSGESSALPKKLTSSWASGLAAAAHLHAFIRTPAIQSAFQSMLIGHKWMIAGITYDPQWRFPPYIRPTAAVTSWYARQLAGLTLLPSELHDQERFDQPWRLGAIPTATGVSILDVLTAGDAQRLRVIVFSRRYEDGVTPLMIDLGQHGLPDQTVTISTLTGAINDGDGKPAHVPLYTPGSATAALRAGRCLVDVPARHLMALEFHR